SPSQLFAAGREKMALAKAKGAVGLIELYNLPTTTWNLLVNYLNKPQLTIDSNPNEDAALPYLWVKDLSNELIAAIDQGKVKEAAINVNGKTNGKMKGKNVIPYIEGTDAKLKNQYWMLSAPYDHVGVGHPNPEGAPVSSGARGNAVGTGAGINAPKYSV